MMKTRIYTLLAALLLTAASTYAQTKIATTLSVTVGNANGITTGEDARVEVSLTDANNNGVTGIVTIVVTDSNDKTIQYKVAVVKGTGTYYVNNLASASYTITASYAGDDVYAASQTATAYNLYVPKITTGLDISFVNNKSTINVGETASVSITLNETGHTNAQGGPTQLETPKLLKINGCPLYGINKTQPFDISQALLHEFVALVNGKGTLKLSGFTAGTYYIKVVYSGDDKYNTSTSNCLTLTVNKQATAITVADITPINAGKDAIVALTATPTDYTGYATVTVGRNSYKVPISGGTGSCIIPNLTEGTHDVTASIADDGKYTGSTSVTKQVTVNEGTNPAIERNAVVTVTTTPDDYNGIVTVTIDGKNYKVAIIDGTGTLVLPQLAADNYGISAELADDGKYAACTNEDAVLVSVTGVTFPFATGQEWATWCDDWAWKKPEGVTAYTISAVSGNTVSISEVEGENIPSHTPLLLKKTSDAVTPTKVITGTGTDDLVSKAAEGATFWGNASDAKITEGYNYAIGQSYGLYNGEFVLIDTDNGIAANRCMLNVGSTNSAPKLSISTDVVGVKEVIEVNASLEVKDDSWYTIDGRKLNGKPTAKGIYINKGIKVVVK